MVRQLCSPVVVPWPLQPVEGRGEEAALEGASSPLTTSHSAVRLLERKKQAFFCECTGVVCV